LVQEPEAQTIPQAPQLRGSEETLVSQPVAAEPSQLAKPGLHANPQTAPLQTAKLLGPAGQTFPQKPQLPTFVEVLTQTPLQLVWPDGQPEPQAPFPSHERPGPQVVPTGALAWPQTPLVQVLGWQMVSVPGQTVPQVPQLPTFVEVLTQTPLQLVWPDGQPEPQAPFEHTCPLWHTVPHAPQLAASVAVLTHAPHQVSPVPQVGAQVHETFTQVPSRHTASAPHTVPHEPQFALLEERSRQTLPQAVSPGGQLTGLPAAAGCWRATTTPAPSPRAASAPRTIDRRPTGFSEASVTATSSKRSLMFQLLAVMGLRAAA